jgi:sugar-specific transcriptional regulator TrmB
MDTLEEFGLTNRESRVYLALLELGSTTTGPIIKKSGVPNSKIYEILESLQNRGLVSWIVKNKTKYFQASSPKKFLTILKDKERKLEEIIPQLEMKQKLGESKKSTEIFEGVKAIRSMLLGLVQETKKGEEWYGFSTGETSINPEIEDFYEWWGARKILAKLHDHLLISAENKEIFEQSLSKEAKEKLRPYLRYSKVSFPGDVAIFRDYVVIFNWGKMPTAILIQNIDLAKQYKNFFLGLWKTSKG